METVIASGKIATVEDALGDPWGYTVQHDILGWSLREVQSDFSTLISQHDAVKIIRRQKNLK